jgi:hypothetical protein
MRVRTKIAASAATAIAASMILAGPASAHTERPVGPIDLEVGFLVEPVYVGSQNAVFVDVSRDGHPITHLGESFSVTVGFGEQTSDPMSFEPLEEPGQYQAPFIPSQPGPYTFALSGRIEGTKVDLSLTSGPKTFNDAEDPSSAMFPAVDTPTAAELAERLERDASRSKDAVAAAQVAAANADDAASSARTIGFIGIALGAIGVIIGGVAFATRRRS